MYQSANIIIKFMIPRTNKKEHKRKCSTFDLFLKNGGSQEIDAKKGKCL
jgi:hypothetical protein